jgi:hypothetical protein
MNLSQLQYLRRARGFLSRAHFRVRCAVVALAATAFVGCIAYDATRTAPSVEALVGTYAPTSKTEADIRIRGQYADAPTRVVLQADGIIHLENLPDWWLDGYGDSHRTRVSASGTWSLEQNQRDWVLGVHISGGQIDGAKYARGFFTQFALAGQHPPYVIHFLLGDPDSRQGMEFARLQGSK